MALTLPVACACKNLDKQLVPTKQPPLTLCLAVIVMVTLTCEHIDAVHLLLEHMTLVKRRLRPQANAAALMLCLWSSCREVWKQQPQLAYISKAGQEGMKACIVGRYKELK
jgi:hypothetical protein